MSQVSKLVEDVQKKFDAGEFDKFIHDICFPRFKGFSPNCRLYFRFPVSILVGPNGGGKTSVLHAAWGMPNKYSTSRFWFSTPVDPIDNDSSNQNRYWYSHYIRSLKQLVQSRKMSGNKRHGYWEPTRPVRREGMEKMPLKTTANSACMSPTGDRWTPVDRTPHYINTKSESSAFDRFFDSRSAMSLEDRQDYFVKYSRKLREVIDGDLSTLKYYGLERVSQNFLLSTEQLAAVNRILQKKYKSARYVTHKFYDREVFSPSVLFETSARTYSETFAGSGELAVVNLVLALEGVGEFDLLLLDEPETSLHPGAQERLLEYVLEITKKKHIQVLISTHSTTFVDLLPATALVVLEETAQGVAPRDAPTKSAAFHRLGVASQDQVTIIAEDKLLKAMVERAIYRMPSEIRKKITVVAAELGVSEMLSNQVRAHIHTKAKVLMVVDGDQRPVAEIFDQDPDSLSLVKRGEAVAGLKSLNVSVLGGTDELAEWMKWCAGHVVVIEEVCAEELFLRTLAPSHVLLSAAGATNSKFKSAVRGVLKDRGDERSGDAQFVLFKAKLGEAAAGGEVDLALSRLSELLKKRLSDLGFI